jgi:hypothetical protein
VKKVPKPATQATKSRRSVDKPLQVSSTTKEWIKKGSGSKRLVPAESVREALPVKE